MNRTGKIGLLVAVVLLISGAAVFAQVPQAPLDNAIINFLQANGVDTSSLTSQGATVPAAVAAKIKEINADATLGPKLDALALTDLKQVYDREVTQLGTSFGAYVELHLGPLTWTMGVDQATTPKTVS